MLSPKLSLALALGALFFFIEAPMRSSADEEAPKAAAEGPKEPVKIGSLYQCDHDLRGTVFVVHDQEVKITGFDYDGEGPSTWFMAMKKGAKAVSSATPGDYVQLPSPDGTCERLKKGQSYSDQTVTIKLPHSIKTYETIGVLCFEFCNNFGHVYIPQDKVYPEAPAGFVAPEECKNPYPTACTVEKTKHNALHPDCPTGTARQEGNSTAIIPHVDKMLVGLAVGSLIINANK